MGGDGFKVRSPQRDEETDRQRVEGVMNAIEAALQAAEREQKGLSERVDEVLARAAVTVGNASDEYLDREPLDGHHQNLFSEEISNGQKRLKSLADAITHFKFLRAAVLSRFPDYRPSAEGRFGRAHRYRAAHLRTAPFVKPNTAWFAIVWGTEAVATSQRTASMRVVVSLGNDP